MKTDADELARRIAVAVNDALDANGLARLRQPVLEAAIRKVLMANGMGSVRPKQETKGEG